MEPDTLRCIFCLSTEHKFSRFTVTVKPKELYKKRQPILYYDAENNKICINKSCIPQELGYKNTNILILEDNKDAIYWSDGISVILGIIKLLEENVEKIDDELINNLAMSVYCNKWWDLLLESIGNGLKSRVEKYYDMNILQNYMIIYLNRIRELLVDRDEIYNNLSKYNFEKYNRILEIFYEDKRRNLEKNIKDKNKEIIKKKQDKIDKKEEEKKKIRENELENYMKKKLNNKNTENINFESIFLNKLNKLNKDKTKKIKLLSFLPLNDETLAYLIMCIGEESNLQDGINISDDKHIIKLWEYYLKQEEDIENNIKYKKIKYNSTKKNNDIPAIPLIENTYLELTKFQKIKFERVYKQYNTDNKLNYYQDNFVLDEWQINTVKTIKDGKSCLIIGPTSGGKTFVMMTALNNIINTRDSKIIVYISPSVELARQTYANIKKTFKNKEISLITFQFMDIRKNSTIYIGTAPELYLYFTKNNLIFNIGIFDEIHVSAKIYYDTDNYLEKRRAYAYSKLLLLCKDQVIAASATIKNEEILCNYILLKMNLIDSEIKIIKYSNRIIPLNEYRYLDNEIRSLKREESGNEIINENNKSDNIPEYNDENKLKLLLLMKEKDMLPVIFFNSEEDKVWNSFLNLINYLEYNEMVKYLEYHRMVDNINNHIEKFNKIYNEEISKLSDKNDNFDVITSNLGKSNIIKKTIINTRKKIINVIISESKSFLKKSIEELNKNKDMLLNMDIFIMSKEDTKKYIIDIKSIIDIEKENFLLSYAHRDMIEIIIKFESMTIEIIQEILLIEINKGNYFRFSKSSCGIEQLNAMRQPGDCQEKWKQRRKMEALANAQNIKTDDIDGIIDIIMKGLNFGISIIISSLPFVIQNIILENIRIKNMGIIFASEEMYMGINYPLRSVIIYNSTNIDINISKLIQMSGRCGRRGKDNQAHVIYWNIQNADKIHETFINPLNSEDLLIDDDDIKMGLFIDNYESLALDMGKIHYEKYFKKNDKDIFIQKKYKEEDYYDDEETNYKLNKNEKVILEKEKYLQPILNILIKFIYNVNNSDEIVKMICNIDKNIIKEEYYVDSFKKSRIINNLNLLIIELYNYYAVSSHIEFLNFLENILNTLKIIEYRLIKISNK